MPQEKFILQEQGADFETGFRMFRSGLNASTRDWWEGKLHEMRSGRVSAEVFVHEMGRGFPGEALPFLRENMTTSDFPNLLLADTADRALLAGYAEEPHTWDQYARVKTNRDLKDSTLLTLDGSEGVMDVINEQGPYPEAALTEGTYTVRVKKRGRKFGFSLELFLNDGLNAFNSTPARFGRAVRRTEEDVITRLYATDAAKAALFTVGNANQVITANGASSNNPVFGIAGIQDALKVMASQRDADNNPIGVQGAILVYPSELEVTAMQIREALVLRGTQLVGNSSVEIDTRNWINGMLTLVPNSRLSIVSETNPTTGWYMFANPSLGRPAIVAARLMGHEQPELFMKSSNAVAISGNGLIDSMQGDFDNDSIMYKVRAWFGGARVDPKAVVFSEGDAS